jgi:two-component system, NtrC family, sensor histidine kinase HydH
LTRSSSETPPIVDCGALRPDADERQRLQRQYNEIALLAGGLAHEIRNPLSTIRMNLDLLFEELARCEHPNVPRMERKLRTISSECGHMEEVLEAFLQFARAGELQLEEVDLGEVIRSFLDVYQPEAQRYGIEVRPHFPADLPRVRLDRRLIRQVLTNLVQNAQQAMPGGGILELQTYVREGHIVLEIIDTGCGMDEAAREKMFQVFYSTKPTGSGLGLPTVRKIVEAHHGTITCESELGRGTKFTLRFPVT